RAGSLLATLDRTATAMGRRMLRAWLLRPLTDLRTIGARQRIIGELVADEGLRAALAAHLAALPDLERLAGRAAARKATPEDLAALAGVARTLPGLGQAVDGARAPFLRSLGRGRPGLAAFAELAAGVLPEREDEGPLRPEASPALAAGLARLRDAGAWQSRYLDRLRRQPGLGRVRLERTSTQGLVLEVPVNTRVPPGWVRRGGLQKVERYSTAELEEHAIELAEAEALVAAETKALLAALRDEAAGVAAEVRDLARYLAAADVSLALALVAAERGWVQPVVDEGDELQIEAGRHPVLE